LREVSKVNWQERAEIADASYQSMRAERDALRNLLSMACLELDGYVEFEWLVDKFDLAICGGTKPEPHVHLWTFGDDEAKQFCKRCGDPRPAEAVTGSRND
jgi:hypothetical protein